MDPHYHLSVITKEKLVFEGDVRSIIAPGSEGYLGVLAHHAPLVTALAPGKLTIRPAIGFSKFYRLGPGFLEVLKNNVLILTERAEEIPETS